jgi:acetolactate synthase-1/2/3 large subunit
MEISASDYIATFLERVGVKRVYTLTGGACAFLVDAVGRNTALEVVCMQNEQAAAMAADAVWRVSRRLGVTMATSGPGATNLITGIACSYFDSIPSMHITGQVNQKERSAMHGANVRQSGFQETDIVAMVKPITKYAVMVRSPDELRDELAKAYTIATSGRMGPVLIDVPIDVQQAMMVSDSLPLRHPEQVELVRPEAVTTALSETLKCAKRPVVLWGGGVGIAGVEAALSDWLVQVGLPFVSSWAGLSAFDHDHPGYLGQIGVYGNRGANFVVQNADTILVVGSRLDNRQRSGTTAHFAREATIHVLDIDIEELKKYGEGGRYRTSCIDLRNLPSVLRNLVPPPLEREWIEYVHEMKSQYFGRESSTTARDHDCLSPYDVIRRLSEIAEPDAIIASDTGAAVCWLHQSFKIKRHKLFTAGGNSPMGYALCAAIGSKLEVPERQVISYNGDGGFQLNIQELQTVKNLDLDISIVIMNNGCYGIIKQFQDSYLESRYIASQDGYSAPDFRLIANAYGFSYARIESLEQLKPDLLKRGAIIIDVILHPQTLIEPKLEMGRPINDQYPYLSSEEYARGNRFVDYPRRN